MFHGKAPHSQGCLQARRESITAIHASHCTGVCRKAFGRHFEEKLRKHSCGSFQAMQPITINVHLCDSSFESYSGPNVASVVMTGQKPSLLKRGHPAAEKLDCRDCSKSKDYMRVPLMSATLLGDCIATRVLILPAVSEEPLVCRREVLVIQP